MRPHVVADIGNTRIKWGLCAEVGTDFRATAALPDDPAAWRQQLHDWSHLTGPLTWVLASVQPPRCERLRDWLRGRGDTVSVLASVRQLPLEVAVPRPDLVGIDRLLDAVAARGALAPGTGAVLIDAGSAVTVDWLDEEHVFRGGAIFPGVRLMAEALHRYTALLPLVTVREPVPSLPADATTPAMQAGIFLAVSGGIKEATQHYRQQARRPPALFLTGGDAELLAPALGPGAVVWKNQTLVGILRSAEALP